MAKTGKNKFNQFLAAARRWPLKMALHPFLTFLAGFVGVMVISAVFLVIFSNLIDADESQAQTDENRIQRFNTKNCLSVFADWEKQKTNTENFLKSDINDAFFSTSTVNIID